MCWEVWKQSANEECREEGILVHCWPWYGLEDTQKSVHVPHRFRYFRQSLSKNQDDKIYCDILVEEKRVKSIHSQQLN